MWNEARRTTPVLWLLAPLYEQLSYGWTPVEAQRAVRLPRDVTNQADGAQGSRSRPGALGVAAEHDEARGADQSLRRATRPPCDRDAAELRPAPELETFDPPDVGSMRSLSPGLPRADAAGLRSGVASVCGAAAPAGRPRPALERHAHPGRAGRLLPADDVLRRRRSWLNLPSSPASTSD